MRRSSIHSVIALLGLVACEKPSSHVYSSPPPPPPATAAAAAAAAATPSTPELPLGTIGPGAKLVSITDAATGAPVALWSITDSVDVLTLVAFGPHPGAAREGGRVELEVRGGSTDTTLVRPLGAPAPSIVAHSFRIVGLRIGRYAGVVRLRANGGRMIAESIPLTLEVVAR